MITFGIDPGLDGAVARLEDGRLCARVMPTLDGHPDLADLNRFLVDDGRPEMVVIEKPEVRPGLSPTSILTIGQNHGRIVGLLVGLGIPYTEVQSKAWKKAMGLPSSSVSRGKDAPPEDAKQKSARLAKARAERKDAAIALAVQLYPSFDFRPSPRCKNRHDGMCEAALLAEYIRRVLCGQVTR